MEDMDDDIDDDKMLIQMEYWWKDHLISTRCLGEQCLYNIPPGDREGLKKIYEKH